MGRQTSVQESNAIRFGSGKFEINDGGGWVDVGAMRDIVFEETWDKIRVMSDNAGAIVLGIRNHQAALAGNLMEFNLERLSELRGGLDIYAEQAGAPLTGQEQVILQGWEFGKFVLLDGQNSNGSAPTVTDVSGTVVGENALVAGDDYNLVKNSAGKWGIVLHDGTKLDTLTQNITVTSNYTPAASKTLEAGSVYTISPIAVRVTNVNEAGDEFIIEVFKATVENGINITLPADDAEDPAMTEIRLQGEVDTAPATSRLFKITDYQT